VRYFLRHLELYLSGVGIVVVIAATVILKGFGLDPWFVGTVTAVMVAVIHGIIFWLVRRRQQAMRVETINEIQLRLKDLINNQLTIIEVASQMRHTDSKWVAEHQECVSNSVNRISQSLDELSSESLQRWKARYARVCCVSALLPETNHVGLGLSVFVVGYQRDEELKVVGRADRPGEVRKVPSPTGVRMRRSWTFL
jgi:membrane protein implicated in regulation of membrane protease activity